MTLVQKILQLWGKHWQLQKVWKPNTETNNTIEYICVFCFLQISHQQLQDIVTILVRAKPNQWKESLQKAGLMTLVHKVLPMWVKLWQLQKVWKSLSETINLSKIILRFLFLQIRRQQFQNDILSSGPKKPVTKSQTKKW